MLAGVRPGQPVTETRHVKVSYDGCAMRGLMLLVRGAAYAALLGASLGCSERPSAPPSQERRERSAEEQRLANLLPDEFEREHSGAQVCLLGTNCLALDSRPFELCLIAAERCPQDARLQLANEREGQGK